MRELSCEDLQVADCDYVARGETAQDVVEEMVDHLEGEHDIGMPDPDVIMETYPDDETFLQELGEVFAGEPDRETRLILERIRSELNIGQQEEIT
jgi:predicted small metal-binding protein